MPRPKPSSDAPLETPFVILIDTREQTPFGFEGLRADAKQGRRPLLVRIQRHGLPSGDYSLAGHEQSIAVERKSLADLLGTLGQGRDRFERELVRLNDMPHALVVVEASWHQVLGLLPACLTDLAQWLGQLHAANPTPEDKAASPPLPFHEWEAALWEVLGPHTFSELNRKTVHRSVIAWRQRYPHVHWDFCGDRRLAEITTFRTLERFWREKNDHDVRSIQ